MNYRYRTSSLSFGGPLTPAVKGLIITCVTVFVVQLLAGQVSFGGLRNPVNTLFMLTPALVVNNFFIWQFFTYIFLHGDIVHLLFNMLTLFMFGCELERHWGTQRFLKYFVYTGVGAGICVFLVPGNYYASTLGASGAIYGVLLAYGMTFPDRIIYVYLLFPIAAKYAVMIFGGIVFLSALAGGNSGISNAAHLGGMIVGYLYLKRNRGSRSGPVRSSGSLFQPLKDAYYEWKLRRAKRKFAVYLNKKQQERDKNETIH